MRRDDGCGKRDSRIVEGGQGHDPGGPIDTDDMRPLIEMPGSEAAMTHSLRGRSAAWLPGIPSGGRQAGAVPRGQFVRRRVDQTGWMSRHNVQEHPECLARGDVHRA